MQLVKHSMAKSNMRLNPATLIFSPNILNTLSPVFSDSEKQSIGKVRWSLSRPPFNQLTTGGKRVGEPDKIVTATRFVSGYELFLNFALLLTVLGAIVHYVSPNDVWGKHVRQTAQSTL